MPRAPAPAALAAVAALAALAGCAEDTRLATKGAATSGCLAADVTPAEIETVSRQIADGEDGWRIETVQRIVRPRGEIRFAVPCPPQMDAAFLASLQRALKARGLYAGPVTGALDGATRAAVRAYQAPRGLDSATLSLASAREMGLVAVPRD